ncbi:MAG: sigma-54-dependent transcriptional regulator [Pseudobdellovibrionaceae bacterium]
MAKILIIDDDLELAEMTAAFFRQKDHQVMISEDAEVSLKDLLKKKESPDLVIVDLRMPKISGIQLIQKLQENQLLIPVILITGDRDVETAMQAISAGAIDYVVKPLNYSQLQISAERALRFHRLESENQVLKSVIQLKEGTGLGQIKGKSPAFLKVLDLARRVAKSQANIAIWGESGTGKEVLARSIHQMSPRKDGPFIAINCSAIPENLLESELFGHAKGSFTGASDHKIGLFEEAEGGTLFLDEIGDMSLPLQAKLLRVIQERKVKRVGENQERDLNVRIISATHRDLKTEVAHHRFREDLYFRLHVIPLSLPPLRERQEDILPLAEFFLRKYATLNESPARSFSREAITWLLKHPWKGNVRELENTIERSVILAQEPQVQVMDLIELGDTSLPNESVALAKSVQPPMSEALAGAWTLESLTKKYILEVLKKNQGQRDRTAKELAMDRKTLYRKLKEIENEQQSPLPL